MIGFKDTEKNKDVSDKRREMESFVDTVLEGRSASEIQRVKDNRGFLKKIAEKPIPKDKEKVRVFGVRDVNINAILKDNIWNRSIFTTDHLCRVVFGMRYEQIRKYMLKKRAKQSDLTFLIIIVVGIVCAIVIILLLMSVDFSKIGLF